MRSTVLALSTIAALGFAVPAAAQGSLSAEVRGSLANPVGDFGDEAGTGFGFGADLMYNVNDAFTLYGGWTGSWLDCEICAGDESISSAGFEGGVKLLLPREEGVLPWARAGVIAAELEFEDDGVEVTSDTGLGIQLSAGVDIPLSPAFSLTPAIRYQTYDADFVTSSTSVAQLFLDVGLHIHLNQLGSS